MCKVVCFMYGTGEGDIDFEDTQIIRSIVCSGWGLWC